MKVVNPRGNSRRAIVYKANAWQQWGRNTDIVNTVSIKVKCFSANSITLYPHQTWTTVWCIRGWGKATGWHRLPAVLHCSTASCYSVGNSTPSADPPSRASGKTWTNSRQWSSRHLIPLVRLCWVFLLYCGKGRAGHYALRLYLAFFGNLLYVSKIDYKQNNHNYSIIHLFPAYLY